MENYKKSLSYLVKPYDIIKLQNLQKSSVKTLALPSAILPVTKNVLWCISCVLIYPKKHLWSLDLGVS